MKEVNQKTGTAIVAKPVSNYNSRSVKTNVLHGDRKKLNVQPGDNEFLDGVRDAFMERALTKFAYLLQKATGSCLGGMAITLQVGNILICVFMLLFGPAVIVNLLIK